MEPVNHPTRGFLFGGDQRLGSLQLIPWRCRTDLSSSRQEAQGFVHVRERKVASESSTSHLGAAKPPGEKQKLAHRWFPFNHPLWGSRKLGFPFDHLGDFDSCETMGPAQASTHLRFEWLRHIPQILLGSPATSRI